MDSAGDSPITGSSIDHGTMQDSQTPLRPTQSRKNTPRFSEEPARMTSQDEAGELPNIRQRSKPGTLSLGRTISRQVTLPQIKSALFKPKHAVGAEPTFWRSIVAILRSSWVNLLLIFIPVSWACHFALPHDFHNRDTIIFVFSFLAIIPLASLLAFATEDVSLRVGQTLAGLMNATLGNAVELIVSIIALVKCELQVVQSSLVGSILSNLLLVTGMCFFAGGLKYSEQGFGSMTTQINSSLLVIAVIAVLLPGAFSFSSTQANEKQDILHMSHGVALILLFVYVGYLIFQLYSHAAMYSDSSDDVAKSTKYEPRKKNKKDGEAEEAPEQEEEEVEEVEEPQMTKFTGIVLLVVVTVLVAVTAEWLVDAIDGMTQSGGISKEFVGIILLPIVGNAAEHVTAITVSVKDKLNLSLQVAVGSSIQIALFVIPFIVILAWIMGKPLSLLFDPYESIALFLAVITVNYVVQDGKSNWLEGFILMCLYVILAVTFWFYQPSSPADCSFLTTNSTIFT